MSLLSNATDLAIERDLKQFMIVLLIALSAASLPKIFTPLRQIPYTLLLVIVGLGLALVNVRLVNLSPGMILLVLLPPILFEAGWNMRWPKLRQEILPSLLFAVGGVLISVAGIGWALHLFGLAWGTALLTGACLSATDSASVVGIFSAAGAKQRLTTLLEGESLFNDGAAVVVFGLLLELAIEPQPVDLSAVFLQFVAVCGIGVGIGAVIGVCVAILTQKFELSWVEQSLTLVTAYGSYLLVEELGGSGVIGVVTAGLVIGNFSLIPGMVLQKRSTMLEFWEFVTFLINSIIFLLLGDQILLPYFIQHLGTTAVAILAVVLTRGLSIMAFSALSGWLTQRPIPLSEQVLLWWVGLRGAVAIALALSIPITVASREQIISNSFGVVLFTLLVQGLTTNLLLRRLDLLEDRVQQQYSELVARRDAFEQVLAHLLQTEAQSKVTASSHRQQIEFVEQQLQQFRQALAQMQVEHPQLDALNLQQQQATLLLIESDAYSKFVQAGILKAPLPSMLQKAFMNE